MSRKQAAPKPEPKDDDVPEVGGNLRRLRSEQNLSLDKLAHKAGVSRAMLGQIELGQSTPTIKTLWKIARALDLPFSALISAGPTGGSTLLTATQTRRLSNHDGKFVSRALFPLGGPRKVEFYEITMAARAEEIAVPHPPGTVENVTVNKGTVEIEVRGEKHKLGVGDVLLFEADGPHVYRNPTDRDAVLYMVVTYA